MGIVWGFIFGIFQFIVGLLTYLKNGIVSFFFGPSQASPPPRSPSSGSRCVGVCMHVCAVALSRS